MINILQNVIIYLIGIVILLFILKNNFLFFFVGLELLFLGVFVITIGLLVLIKIIQIKKNIKKKLNDVEYLIRFILQNQEKINKKLKEEDNLSKIIELIYLELIKEQNSYLSKKQDSYLAKKIKRFLWEIYKKDLLSVQNKELLMYALIESLVQKKN